MTVPVVCWRRMRSTGDDTLAAVEPSAKANAWTTVVKCILKGGYRELVKEEEGARRYEDMQCHGRAGLAVYEGVGYPWATQDASRILDRSSAPACLIQPGRRAPLREIDCKSPELPSWVARGPPHSAWNRALSGLFRLGLSCLALGNCSRLGELSILLASTRAALQTQQPVVPWLSHAESVKRLDPPGGCQPQSTRGGLICF